MNNFYKYDKIISFLEKIKKNQIGGGNDITTYYKDFPELIALLDKYNINGYVKNKTDVISKEEVNVISDLLIQKIQDKKIEKEKNEAISKTKNMSLQPLLSVIATHETTTTGIVPQQNNQNLSPLNTSPSSPLNKSEFNAVSSWREHSISSQPSSSTPSTPPSTPRQDEIPSPSNIQKFYKGNKIRMINSSRTGVIEYLRDDETEKINRKKNPTQFYYSVKYDDGDHQSYVSQDQMI